MIVARTFAEITPAAFNADDTFRLPGAAYLARAVENSPFRNSHPDTKLNIIERFVHSGLPLDTSVWAIEAGHSSPSAFRRDRRLHRKLGLTRADFTIPKN